MLKNLFLDVYIFIAKDVIFNAKYEEEVFSPNNLLLEFVKKCESVYNMRFPLTVRIVSQRNFTIHTRICLKISQAVSGSATSIADFINSAVFGLF